MRRGFIVDVFDPAHALPIRFEFYDDLIERIGAFKPSTQKSSSELMHLKNITLHGISLENNKCEFPTDLIPKSSLIIFFESEKIITQADSFTWLWKEIFSEHNDIYEIQTWDNVFNSLEALKNIKITSNFEKADFELNISPLPAFKGNPEILTGICN